ncbi:MAG: aldehyde dehydrogenase family protein, partial [Planctomycetota bacterium]
MTDALKHPPSSYIDGRFVPITGDELVSRNPANTDSVVWSATPPTVHLDDAVAAARKALPAWSRAPLEERAALLKRWQSAVEQNLERIAGLITDEMGKVLTESRAEAKLLADKVSITLDDVSFSRVRDYEVKAGETRTGHCRFKPYGVMAVLGPFNFPAHLPNGHFVPALLLGNTVVFKPSRHTPAVGQLIGELMHEAGVPPGVFNVIHSGRGVASGMTTHDDVDGVLLTGSWPVGRGVIEANLDRPGRILALELGGNNPTVVMSDCHFKQAVIECVRASFATSGQRCTCTSRIIVEEPISERFIKAFCRVTERLSVGPGRSTDPVYFMGPVVSEDS